MIHLNGKISFRQVHGRLYVVPSDGTDSGGSMTVITVDHPDTLNSVIAPTGAFAVVGGTSVPPIITVASPENLPSDSADGTIAVIEE